jgi:phage baseplate assembly protein W
VVTSPHFAQPFRLIGSGSFAVVEQDSDQEILDSVAICLATPQGSRAEVPDYGVPRLEFSLPSGTDIVAAVQEWEPRASLTVEVAAALAGDESVARLTVLVANSTGEDDDT